jgi:hypothetical protein
MNTLILAESQAYFTSINSCNTLPLSFKFLYIKRQTKYSIRSEIHYYGKTPTDNPHNAYTIFFQHKFDKILFVADDSNTSWQIPQSILLLFS